MSTTPQINAPQQVSSKNNGNSNVPKKLGYVVELPKSKKTKKKKKRICDYFVENLLLPNTYQNMPLDSEFIFTSEEIGELLI